MANENKKIEDIISLIEKNYNFLHTGLFLSEYIKKNNLSNEAKKLDIRLEDKKIFILKREVIKNYLESCYIGSDKPNIIGYFVEWNSFRGIFMAIFEGEKNLEFKNYLKKRLQKFFHFDAIIRFCRNVLSHNIDSEIKLTEDDFKGIKKHINNNPCKFENNIVNFGFNYKKDFDKNCDCPEEYGFKIEIDFSKIEVDQKFTDIISEFNLFMLSELCYNLAMDYKNNKK